MNTFGQGYVEGSQHALQFPLYDALRAREERMRYRRETIPALRRANSFYCPTGRYPARGWVLMRRGDYNQLNKYSTTLQLNIGDTLDQNNVGPLSNLAIVQAQCVTRGLATDTNALYLVEVTDGRGILANRWFKFPVTIAYNIRASAYPQTFMTSSLNGGTTWTWSTMLQNLWEQMGTFLGTWPGLPFAPAGTPEGFWMIGLRAWDMLNDILDHLGMTITCDLTATNRYTIVEAGDDDDEFDGLQTDYESNLEDDQEWIDTGAGRVPQTVKVLFKRRNAVYGTEETVRYDALQWNMSPYYSVTTSAPATFASAVGSHYIWSDFTVRYDEHGLPIAEDVTTAAQIAAERSAQYFNLIYRQTSGRMAQVYAGALPFSTGSQVDGVCWYQDYGAEDRQGWRTKIVRGINPPFDIYE